MLVFQFPLSDFLLIKDNYRIFLLKKCKYWHDCFISGSNLVDMKVAVSLHEFLNCTILIGHSYHAFQILKQEQKLKSIVLIIYLCTWKASSFSTLTFPSPPWAWPILNTHGYPPVQSCRYQMSSIRLFKCTSYNILMVLIKSLLNQWEIFFS